MQRKRDGIDLSLFRLLLAIEYDCEPKQQILAHIVIHAAELCQIGCSNAMAFYAGMHLSRVAAFFLGKTALGADSAGTAGKCIEKQTVLLHEILNDSGHFCVGGPGLCLYGPIRNIRNLCH